MLKTDLKGTRLYINRDLAEFLLYSRTFILLPDSLKHIFCLGISASRPVTVFEDNVVNLFFSLSTQNSTQTVKYCSFLQKNAKYR